MVTSCWSPWPFLCSCCTCFQPATVRPFATRFLPLTADHNPVKKFHCPGFSLSVRMRSSAWQESGSVAELLTVDLHICTRLPVILQQSGSSVSSRKDFPKELRKLESGPARYCSRSIKYFVRPTPWHVGIAPYKPSSAVIRIGKNDASK